jgi:O-antigen ligase
MHWTLLLLLLFTGPPKFRVRSADAAASGDVDFAAMIQLAVWVLAALFTAYQLYRNREHLHFTTLHKLGLLVIGTMALSTVASMSPELTAFKTAQVATAFAFCWLYVVRFGTHKFFHGVMIGSLFLCGAVVALWFVDPSMVVLYEASGQARLRGQAVYEVAHPAVFGLILLLTGAHKLPRGLRLLSAILFGSALLLSVDRIDWLAFAVVVGIAVTLQVDIPGHKWAKMVVWLSPVGAVLLLSFLTRMRELDSLYTDSARLGLWAYIIGSALDASPWIGTGFISGSRLLGMEYSSTLASGHSIFVDALSGCGLLGLSALLALVIVMVKTSVGILRRTCDGLSFTAAVITIALLIISLVGAEIEATPFGVLFWGLLTALPASRDAVSTKPRGV